MDDRRHDGARLAGSLGSAKKGAPDGPRFDEALGRSRGGLTTKLHVVCDVNGLPLAVHVTAGQRSESAEFEAVCALVEVPRRPVRLLADRGYDAKRIRPGPIPVPWLRERRIRAVIPERKLSAGTTRRRRGRPPVLDRVQYARRNAVERLIEWLKEHRSLTTRFDKRADSFLAMVKLGCIHRLLRAAFPHRA